MRTIKTIFLTLFAVCLSFQTFAQDHLSEPQKQFIQRRAAQKTGQLNNYIAYMVDVARTRSERMEYMQSAKDLFIGRAEYYTFEGMSKIAKMQVTSVTRRTTKPPYPVKDYFVNLVNLLEYVYDKITVVATEINDMQVSRLYHLYDNVYECTVSYVQMFCGYKDGRPKYGPERTKKNMKCLVFILDDEDGGYEIAVVLSDCEATETERIKQSDLHSNSGLLIPDR